MFRNCCSKSTKARSVLALLVVGALGLAATLRTARKIQSRQTALGGAWRERENLMQLRPALDAEKGDK